MNEQLTVVTRKGQVTIPADIRHTLGIKEGDKVAFVLERDQVKLTRKEVSLSKPQECSKVINQP